MKYRIILFRCWFWMFLLRSVYHKKINRIANDGILPEEDFNWLFNQFDNRLIKALADKLEYLYRR